LKERDTFEKNRKQRGTRSSHEEYEQILPPTALRVSR
jgi:hypothetical protein